MVDVNEKVIRRFVRVETYTCRLYLAAHLSTAAALSDDIICMVASKLWKLCQGI